MSIAVALVAAVVFCGLALVLRAFRPKQIPLHELLVDRRRDGTEFGVLEDPDVSHRVGSAVLSLLGDANLWSARVSADLAVIGRSDEEHVGDKSLYCAIGAIGPFAAWFVITLVGGSPPTLLLVLVGVALASGGFFLPDYLVTSEASEKRDAFRFALSSYLDLVNTMLASGAGIETALWVAADAGGGAAFSEIRQALFRASLTGRSSWAALHELGLAVGVKELVQLANSVQLAGEHGSRVRDSLASRAEAMRAARISAAEIKAERTSEQMVLPNSLVLGGFVLFILYPAIEQFGGSF